ncbi:MAG: amidohydrolase, partial [Opitutaceae bacterium]
MRIRLLLAAVFTALSGRQLPLAAAENPLRGAVVANVEREFPSLLALYTDLHRNPEIWLMEERTAAVIAGELRAAGIVVTEGFGGGAFL